MEIAITVMASKLPGSFTTTSFLRNETMGRYKLLWFDSNHRERKKDRNCQKGTERMREIVLRQKNSIPYISKKIGTQTPIWVFVNLYFLSTFLGLRKKLELTTISNKARVRAARYSDKMYLVLESNFLYLETHPEKQKWLFLASISKQIP